MSIEHIISIITLVSLICSAIWFLFKGNRDFFKLLNDFQEKLPPKQKRAKEIEGLIPIFTVIDTTNMKMNLSSEDIDLFQKRLETFKYNKIFFKRKEIIEFSKNLQRHLSSAKWEKFAIANVQSLLEDEPFKKHKPYLLGYRIGSIIGF